ncbi:MAG: transcription-repair coupling factor, partial [Bacteroidetes bacterium]|nr:transcription-repair coupling factor [Bacteroidota bacterium]
MNLGVLMNYYRNDPRCLQIANGIVLPQPQHFQISGTYGSAAQFILASVFENTSTPQNHLVILNEGEDAAYFHNSLQNITGALEIFYFPSTFKNKKNFSLVNSSHVMLRTEALTKIAAGGNKKILITHADALFEKVVLSKTLFEKTLHIKQADELDVDLLIEKCVNYGFEKTDFVYEPGQFAIRGGIIDIYSFGNEKPYRIELFGKEVDSIRIFDPETQLSERKLLQVNIIPNIDTQFQSTEKVSLLEFLPANTAVWLEDWDFVKERLVQMEEDLEIFLSVKTDATPGLNYSSEPYDYSQKLQPQKQDFIRAADLELPLSQKHIISFGKTPSFAGPAQKLIFNTAPQPAFNRNFSLLIRDLQEHEKNQYNIFIFAEQARQLERLHSIF